MNIVGTLCTLQSTIVFSHVLETKYVSQFYTVYCIVIPLKTVHGIEYRYWSDTVRRVGEEGVQNENNVCTYVRMRVCMYVVVAQTQCSVAACSSVYKPLYFSIKFKSFYFYYY